MGIRGLIKAVCAGIGLATLTPIAAAQVPRDIPCNIHGAPVRTASGEPITYGRDAIAQQAQRVPPAASTPRALLGNAAGGTARWNHFAFGTGLGVGNIVVSRAGAFTEMILFGGGVSFSGGPFWMIVRHDPTTQSYQQVFVSPITASSDGLRRIRAADMLPSTGPEIVVAFDSGKIELWSQLTRTKLGEFQTSISKLTGLCLVDIDGDQDEDVLVCSASAVAAYDVTGTELWKTTAAGGNEVVAAQMDNDPALEVATTDGTVIDAATQQVEWSWANGFGFDLEAADIDNDGKAELLAAESWNDVWAFDVDTKLPKWSIPIFNTGAIYVGDVDNDNVVELIVGEAQWGSQICYDTTTRTVEWSVRNPEHGTTANAYGDVDGDNQVEVIWGAGFSSSGSDHLFVADIATQTIEWQNIHLDSPFHGPLMGDVTGDAIPEIVAASHQSDSGYSGGRILVFDSISLSRLAVSQRVGSSARVESIALVNVDQDSANEIVIGSSDPYDGTIRIFDFNGSTFTTLWTTPSSPRNRGPYRGVHVVDLDGDNRLEVIGGSTNHVFSFDYGTTTLDWQTPFSLSSDVMDIVIGDSDGDSALELHALTRNGDVYVFDGKTGQPEAILNKAKFTSIRITKTGKPLVMLGDDQGRLWLAPHDGQKYDVVGGAPIALAAVDGFTFFESIPMLTVGASDVMTVWLPPGFPVWNTASYAPINTSGSRGFGSHTIIAPAPALGITAGWYGLSGFRP